MLTAVEVPKRKSENESGELGIGDWRHLGYSDLGIFRAYFFMNKWCVCKVERGILLSFEFQDSATAVYGACVQIRQRLWIISEIEGTRREQE